MGCTSSTGQGKGFSRFQKDALTVHNQHRSKHGAPPLKLNAELCEIAQNWADHLLKTHTFTHNRGQLYNGDSMGESLASVVENLEKDAISAAKAVGMWYDESNDYKFHNPGFSMTTGHFTQLVWKTSTDLGIGIATTKNRNGQTEGIVVGNYWPAGNMQGEFEKNVQKAS